MGAPIAKNISTEGMVIDFGDIKQLVNDSVLTLFDHRLILKHDSRFKGLEKSNPRIRYVNYQPTCENMLIEIVNILNKHFKEEVLLHSVLLRETANSYAEWFASDNI